MHQLSGRIQFAESPLLQKSHSRGNGDAAPVADFPMVGSKGYFK